MLDQSHFVEMLGTVEIPYHYNGRNHVIMYVWRTQFGTVGFLTPTGRVMATFDPQTTTAFDVAKFMQSIAIKPS